MFDRDECTEGPERGADRQTIHDQAMRILTEIGTDVLHEPAREALAAAGQRVEDERVRYDPDWVIEQVAKAPATFPIQARNPERSVVIGEGPPICMNVGGPPFASDLDEGRRSGRSQDHDTLVKMTQASDLLTFVQSGAVEPQDLDVVTRHMDCDYSVLRWSDKPYVCYGTSGPKARDAVELAAIVFGGREALAERPALLGIVNPNSPLIWDFRMTDALMEWAEAGQGVVVTPFLLAGGTSPVSVAGALSISRWRRRCPASRSRRPCGPACRACSARSSPRSTCARARRRSARPSPCSASSPARSSRGATGCRSAAAAGSRARTASTGRRRPRPR